MQKLLLATRNSHKTAEIRQMLGDLCSVEDLNTGKAWPEIEETAETFAGNATLKAVGISTIYPGLVLSDDSGLEVDALHGEPGVRSARFAGAKASDAANRAMLLQRLTGVPAEQRAARFRCIIALAQDGKLLATFEGAVKGSLLEEEKGSHGFGYDSLFVPEGFTETFAELPSETKNQLSHRARALEKTRKFLLEKLIA